ncbi:polysaccharide pyruvyl transferase family protein [Microbacterium foliorum]|uniref:Polysaccharide pyruvyl transferase family protein n=1 Tax=Microbacterium foliorum TaxID=104336 RepID=A0A4Y5YS86_9MICO|nr:polysaccharide pyruvyl transferase family protein [Microbacterium foliorum]
MPDSSKRAVVVGPYRVHNFGDDLVGAIIAKHLQRAGYDVTVPKLGEQNAEWLGIEYAEDYGDLIQRSDMVVVGGGGILSDTSGSKPGASYLDIVAQAALRGELTGKRVMVTSVGAGPWILEKSKMLAFAVSILAEKIGVREQESYDHLASIGVSGPKVVLGADCALLSADYLDFAPRRGREMGFQFDVGSFEDLKANPRLQEISDAAIQYVRDNAKKITLISNGRGRPQLAASAPDTGIMRYAGLEDYLGRLSGHKTVFTSHLHLAITSYSQRIPTVSLYVREKTRRFYEQIGHPERAVDLSTATVDDFKRLIAEAETAVWTDKDEETLQRLKGDARRLLEFID